MQISEEFLNSNNITLEDYESYYNSIELPSVQKSTNKHGLTTLTINDISVCFREDTLSEEEANLRLEESYRRSKTEIHFLELTRQKQQMETNNEEQISADENWKNNVTISLEYMTCLLELSTM